MGQAIMRSARRRILMDQSGSLMIDFAIVMIPVTFVLLVLVDIGLVLLAQQALQTRTTNAARSIEQGAYEGVSGSDTQAAMRASICAGTLILVPSASCESRVRVDVRSVDGTSIPSIIDGEGNLDDGSFGGGSLAANAPILIRSAVELPLLTSFVGNLIPINGGRRIISAIAVIRVDPFAAYNRGGALPGPGGT